MTLPSLQSLLLASEKDIEQISDYFDALVKEAVARINRGFSIKRLIKQPRSIEPLPEVLNDSFIRQKSDTNMVL
ncbi:MAG: hypothetical protein GPJ13_21545 [Microcystis aeruginosa W11-06]|nr:hypothetical protein [Microcystis aeruginosa W11-03]NCR96157.1 hypothetical protein [Microcystis aeruginosa W11-06]